jgi:hypothetical protein
MQSLVSSIKNGLFDQLLNSINQKFGDSDTISPFYEWVKEITLDGKPFTYDRHEYLIEPYQDDHPHQVEMKAAQLGLTSLAMLRAVYGARYRGFKGILYLFPFWRCFLYFRGMRSRAGLKSVPVDFLVCDELDEAPQAALDMAYERMAHSEFKEVLKLSNPTLPDYGIDQAFQETDQRYWLLKCEKCGEHTCLEDTFPDCLITLNGKVIRACQKCLAELNPSVGQWVAKKPGVTDKRGYHHSQLFSHFVDPADILHQFRTTNNLTDFYNLKIGIAYVEAQNRLSVQEVLALCGSEGIASQDLGPCSMGVDQGKDLHVVIGKRHPQKAGKIVHLEIYKDWEELDRLMRNFNVSRCVVDALPETRNARAFAERHKGKVFLNYYNEHQKGHYAWNEKELIVSCNRTESLDASHREIMDQAIILPKECEITQIFAEHLHYVAKKLEEDEETGSKRYVYVRLGPDHFRHAFNYEAMARQAEISPVFPGFDPNKHTC